MKQLLSNRWLLLLLRSAIATTFIYAGVIKIIAPQDFADSIESFGILPAFLLSIVALALPPFEVLVGGLLLAGRLKRQAAASILILATVFAIALVQALVRGLDVDCGCFGNRQSGAWSLWLSLGRSVLLLASSGWVYSAYAKEATKVPDGMESIGGDGFDSRSVILLDMKKYDEKSAEK